MLRRSNFRLFSQFSVSLCVHLFCDALIFGLRNWSQTKQTNTKNWKWKMRARMRQRPVKIKVTRHSNWMLQIPVPGELRIESMTLKKEEAECTVCGERKTARATNIIIYSWAVIQYRKQIVFFCFVHFPQIRTTMCRVHAYIQKCGTTRKTCWQLWW